MCWIGISEDDPERAQRDLDKVANYCNRSGLPIQQYSCLVSQVQIDLYTMQGGRGLDHINEKWSSLEKSFLLYVQQTRIFLISLRASCALSAAMATPDPRFSASFGRV
jgi:hypothetical protein